MSAGPRGTGSGDSADSAETARKAVALRAALLGLALTLTACAGSVPAPGPSQAVVTGSISSAESAPAARAAAAAASRQARIERSPHFVDGRFRNLESTELLAPGESRASIMASFLRPTEAQLRPLAPLPSVRVDLRTLDPAQDTVIWLGHSSFFVMLGGRRILIDPVFTQDAAPVAWVNRAFNGSTPYTLADLPPIDLLLITHDHWDHLDEPTVSALASRVARVITPLGVGRYLEDWGYPPERITEADWFEAVALGAGLTVHAVPARHFSGRWLLRNRTQWAGYVLESGTRRLYFSGDTGDGSHFAEIARRFPRFDLVALDMGQYDPRWPAVHMNPEQAAQAATVLRTRALLPAHVGRFRMARHGWSESLDRITAASAGQPYTLVTPRIGEPMRLDETLRRWPRWWQGLPAGQSGG